jgi:hypothetical protein
MLWGMKSPTVVAWVEDVTGVNVYGSRVEGGVFVWISGLRKFGVMDIGVEGTGIWNKRFGSNVLRIGFSVVDVDDVVCSAMVKVAGNMLCVMTGLRRKGIKIMMLMVLECETDDQDRTFDMDVSMWLSSEEWLGWKYWMLWV